MFLSTIKTSKFINECKYVIQHSINPIIINTFKKYTENIPQRDSVQPMIVWCGQRLHFQKTLDFLSDEKHRDLTIGINTSVRWLLLRCENA